MWSDPEEIDTWAVSPRGAGWLFGQRVAEEFNRINSNLFHVLNLTSLILPPDLELICRAHQLVQEGLKYMFPGDEILQGNTNLDRPQYELVTVWSAPNYCYRCGNVASILSFDEHLNRTEKVFEATEENETTRPPKNNSRYFL